MNNKPKYKLAITIVEECNKALIGVGAFIAYNSHEEKGNWADIKKKMTKNVISK